MAAKKGSKPDLALVLDVGGPSKKPPMSMMGKGMADNDADEGASEYGGEFESAAEEAFPEMADDPAKLDAFWRAVRACMEKVQGM